MIVHIAGGRHRGRTRPTEVTFQFRSLVKRADQSVSSPPELELVLRYTAGKGTCEVIDGSETDRPVPDLELPPSTPSATSPTGTAARRRSRLEASTGLASTFLKLWSGIGWELYVAGLDALA